MFVRGKLLVCFGLLLMPSSILMASEWYVQPTAKLNAVYDDNLMLRTGKNPDAYGYQATFLGQGGIRSALSNIALTAQTDIVQYWGEKNLDRNNWNVGISAEHNLTERDKVGLNAGYLSDTSLTSELLSTGFLTTAIGNKQIDRKSFSVSPSWSHQLSETKRVKANYAHQEVTYDTPPSNTIGNSLSSYETDSASLVFSEQWSPLTSYNMAFSAMRYAITDFPSNTDNFSFTLGLDHQYSDTLSVSFMVGGRKTDTTYLKTTEESYGPLYSVGLAKQFELGNIGLNYSSSTSPSGIGLFLISDDVTVNTSYNVMEHLKLMVSGEALFTESSSNNAINFNRSYYTLETKLAWDFNKHLSLVGGYRYRTQQYNDTGNNSTDAASNSVFVYFEYHLDELTTNRF
jgi:hypothetical protein